MVSEATIEAYKAMTKDSECPSMETQIRENLERTCDKFAGDEDKDDIKPSEKAHIALDAWLKEYRAKARRSMKKTQKEAA